MSRGIPAASSVVHMKPIDRPFRFTWDFCIVWLMLAVPSFFLARAWDAFQATLWSSFIFTLLLSLFATFVIYGPVLLMRQVIRSGSRGGFVARVAITIVLVVTLFLFGFSTFGRGRNIPPWLVVLVSAAAAFYLHLRTDKRQL